MKEELFVVGDVHGQISMLEELLVNWNEKTQTLLFLGDIIDRGEDSKACLERVRNLVSSGKAICLKGNHEQMLESFIKMPHEKFEHYRINGGMETLRDLLPGEPLNQLSPAVLTEKLQARYPWLLPYLESLPLFEEWGNYVFVHAGVDLSLSNWKESSPRDFIWIREEFYKHPNHSGNVFVFGHTPTPVLNEKETDHRLFEQNNLIGMDGGAVYGGVLYGLVFSKQKVKARYKVENEGSSW